MPYIFLCRTEDRLVLLGFHLLRGLRGLRVEQRGQDDAGNTHVKVVNGDLVESRRLPHSVELDEVDGGQAHSGDDLLVQGGQDLRDQRGHPRRGDVGDGSKPQEPGVKEASERVACE